MSRASAHAAIVLILSDVPYGYPFSDAADDTLDAIWPTEPPMPTGDTFIDTYSEPSLVSRDCGVISKKLG